jgi:hypothetical protein
MQLKEDFLHYIWQYRLLTCRNMRCKDGQPLQIVDPGVKNTNAGPDFTVARLRIDRQLWAGNVEIHVKASDWFLHRHESDRAYDTVILHAVYEDDTVIYRTDGTLIPVLVLKDIIPEEQLSNYLQMISGRSFVPCAQQLKDADGGKVRAMLGQMIRDRFAEKANELLEKMQQNKHNWQETYYYLLLRNFGFKINSVPFELLADALPNKLIARYRNDPQKVAALLFGVAGFLNRDFKDDYPRQLKVEFQFLQKKHHLKTLDRSIWKFLRIHPQNFPSLRIAQVAALLAAAHSRVFQMPDSPSVNEIIRIYTAFPADAYWHNHSDFDKVCKPNSTKLGKYSAYNLVINTTCLILYTYGSCNSYPQYIEMAIALLKTLPPERNALLLRYQEAGLKLQDAWDSQAVLQLNKKLCSQKKCLDCMIGIDLLGLHK